MNHGLVAHFERYPELAPWVRSTQYLERSPAAVVGRLDMQYSTLRESFTTRTLLEPPRQITMAVAAKATVSALQGDSRGTVDKERRQA
jgi:ribosome-associated toxin RatA of RatAB toxin-antitoxin module